MDGKQVNLKQAREVLGVSRFLFNENYRPHLTEIKRGPRSVFFDMSELKEIKHHASFDKGNLVFAKRTVKAAIDHAWEVKWKGARGSDKKESLKNIVIKEIGDVSLAALDYNRIEEWVEDLKGKGRAIATIKSRLSCLTFALDLAVKKGWIKSVPHVPRLGSSAKKDRYLQDEPDEEALLMAACDSLDCRKADAMKRAIVFALDTGCRLSELLKVTWRDISPNGVMFVERKRGDTHRVTLTDQARDAIESLLNDPYWQRRVRGADTNKRRCRSAQNWVTHNFGKVRDKARLYDVTFHTLRHTCASRLVQAGISLQEVCQVLGHSSIVVTERYAHLAPKNMENAINVLNNRRLPDKVRSGSV